MLKASRPRSLLILAASIVLSIAVAGCGDSDNTSLSSLSSANINMIFVVSQDLAHNDGDINFWRVRSEFWSIRRSIV